jgi:hypothetical protein
MKERDMRMMVCAVVMAAMTWAAGPVWAQTYDPRYPVCMQTYGPFSGIDCSYISMANCRFLAQGRGGQCLTNPYFVQRQKSRH